MEETMSAVVVTDGNHRLEARDVPVPRPGAGQVLIRVEACGVCHGDSMVLAGAASSYPRIPGHEVVGRIAELGEGVEGWEVGQRVGVGWHGGHGNTTGLTMDGGYAEYMVAYEDGLVAIPDGISSEEAAPILCAGETVYSAIRGSRLRIGDLVAVSGIGGLGHLAVQYASRAGMEVVVISHGEGKRELAGKLGAHHYIDSGTEDPAEALRSLGGADVIIATAPDTDTIRGLLGGLRAGGELILAAVDDRPIGWSALDFLGGQATVKGTFTDKDAMGDAVRFSVLTGAMPMVETFPLGRAQEAFDRMMSADVRFRAVITMDR